MSRLRDLRVIVTGGAGALGSATVEALRHRGAAVCALDLGGGDGALADAVIRRRLRTGLAQGRYHDAPLASAMRARLGFPDPARGSADEPGAS